MREKLIELIENAPVWKSASLDEACKQVADHLIANGVTVREKGEWENYMPYIKYNPNNRITKKRCSVCKNDASPFTTSFCPSCGADLRGEE